MTIEDEAPTLDLATLLDALLTKAVELVLEIGLALDVELTLEMGVALNLELALEVELTLEIGIELKVELALEVELTLEIGLVLEAELALEPTSEKCVASCAVALMPLSLLIRKLPQGVTCCGSKFVTIFSAAKSGGKYSCGSFIL